MDHDHSPGGFEASELTMTSGGMEVNVNELQLGLGLLEQSEFHSTPFNKPASDMSYDVTSSRSLNDTDADCDRRRPTCEEKTTVCSPELALSALELSLTDNVLALYNRCFLNNAGLCPKKDDGGYFNTWKHYKKLVVEKEKQQLTQRENVSSCRDDSHLSVGCSTSTFYGNKNCRPNATQLQPADPLSTFGNTSGPNDHDSDVLPYPRATSNGRPRPKKDVKEHYFVLTAKEVYESKLAAAKSKEEKLVLMEKKRGARLHAAKLKEGKKNAIRERKEEVVLQTKMVETESMTKEMAQTVEKKRARLCARDVKLSKAKNDVRDEIEEVLQSRPRLTETENKKTVGLGLKAGNEEKKRAISRLHDVNSREHKNKMKKNKEKVHQSKIVAATESKKTRLNETEAKKRITKKPARFD